MKWNEAKKEIKSVSEEEILYIELVADIVTIRKDKGITQAKLGEMTGLKQAAIARFESCAENANTLTLLKITNALNYELTLNSKSEK